MAELDEGALALIAQLDDESLGLALRLAALLSDSRRQSRRTLRRALEDAEDGMATTMHVLVDPSRSKRGERVDVFSTTGTQLPQVGLNVPGLNLRSAS